ncbi:MAG: hypothetical protein KBD01_04020 [Acidobacteria bacterium]|nr:hypothetical protein [Acidobacteriota bacterium]
MPTRKSTASSRKTAHAREVFAVAEKSFAQAMDLYLRQRDWQRAREAFAGFLNEYGHERDVDDMSDRARVHLASCERKLAAEPPAPGDAAEWLVRAVFLSNSGDIDGALDAFRHAEEQGVAPGRLHYAKAAALALAERNDEALEELRLAIEADPNNRAHSLGDPDFERLRETAGYVELVEPPMDEFDYDDEEDDDLPEDDEEEFLNDGEAGRPSGPEPPPTF